MLQNRPARRPRIVYMQGRRCFPPPFGRGERANNPETPGPPSLSVSSVVASRSRPRSGTGERYRGLVLRSFPKR